MPRYDFSPDAVSASIEILSKGEYEFIVGEPKSFMRKNRKGEDSYGIRFPLVLAEDMNGHKKGTRIFFNTYQQSEGAQAIGKQFLMAVLGYKRNQEAEKQFNDDFTGKDFGFNTDDGSVGDGWMEVKGKRVKGDLDVGINEENQQQVQDFKAGCWSPIQ